MKHNAVIKATATGNNKPVSKPSRKSYKRGRLFSDPAAHSSNYIFAPRSYHVIANMYKLAK